MINLHEFDSVGKKSMQLVQVKSIAVYCFIYKLWFDNYLAS